MNFDRDGDEVEDRFIDLADGRTLFLPRGRGGRVFLVPDESTRLRLWRTYTWGLRGTRIAAVLAGVAAFRFGHVTVALAVIPSIVLFEWVVEQVSVGGLQQVHDPFALAETAPRHEASALTAMAFVGVGTALCAGAAWVFTVYPGKGETAAGLGLLGVALLLGGLRSLRDMQNVTRPHDAFENRPVVPR